MKNNKSTQLISLIALILLGGCNIDSHLQNSIAAESTQTIPRNGILDQGTSFFCDQTMENPTIIARSDLGNVRVIVFKRNVGQWTASKRCSEVANRFMKFHKEQKLSYLTWARVPDGGGRVINIAKREGDLFRSAEFVDLLFTLKQDDQVHEILESLHGILSSYGDSPISN